MNVLEFSLLVWLGSLAAGFLGALTGLGGGVVLVPLLVLGFGVDLRYAIGASLVSVIATSSGAAAAYVKEGYSNIRVGLFLEIATTLGALGGAFLAMYISGSALAVTFGVILIVSAFLSSRPRPDEPPEAGADPLAAGLRRDGSYPTPQGRQAYHVRHVPLGWLLMVVAGVLSGLLGIGSGAFKVLAMDQAMRIPFKASTTTSNFMIGVTAAASAGVYFSRGDIDPFVAAPVAAGVLHGAPAGSRLLGRLRNNVIRIVFVLVLLWVSTEMLLKGIRR